MQILHACLMEGASGVGDMYYYYYFQELLHLPPSFRGLIQIVRACICMSLKQKPSKRVSEVLTGVI